MGRCWQVGVSVYHFCLVLILFSLSLIFTDSLVLLMTNNVVYLLIYNVSSYLDYNYFIIAQLLVCDHTSRPHLNNM